MGAQGGSDRRRRPDERGIVLEAPGMNGLTDVP